MEFKKTIVFDFDGVIHSYKSGWKGVTNIPDGPVSGIKEVIDDLRQDFKVVIVSTRCFQDGGIGAIREWLNKYKIEVDDVLGEKPPAIVYIDDRAICINGDFVVIESDKNEKLKYYLLTNIRVNELREIDKYTLNKQIEIPFKSEIYESETINKKVKEYCRIYEI